MGRLSRKYIFRVMKRIIRRERKRECEVWREVWWFGDEGTHSVSLTVSVLSPDQRPHGGAP
jgi:hypothetical protein